MKYVLKPSLEHMALVRIVVTLWNQNEIRALMEKLNFNFPQGFIHRRWKKIEDRVIEKVPQLSIPELLKEKMSGFIKPVGLQYLKWLEDHSAGSCLQVGLPPELCWTSQGTVDRKRTAEKLIEDGNLDNSKRFKLACNYCLKDNIQQMWNEIPQDLRKSYLHETFPNEVVFLWTCDIKQESWNTAHFSCKSVFESSARVGNKAAVEYFLQKLTPTEREESLVRATKRVRDSDILCFLLSIMDEEQQTEVFKSNPYVVLQCFLNYPLQSFFIEIANCMWDFLSKQHYDILLHTIINKQDKGFKDWNYQKLFGEFWQKSPSALKHFVKNDFYHCVTLLFHVKDKENDRSILKGVTPIEKEKLIYCDSAQSLFQRFICEEEWDILECFIHECLPSKDEMLKFKEEFENQVFWQCANNDLPQLFSHLGCLSPEDEISDFDRKIKDIFGLCAENHDVFQCLIQEFPPSEDESDEQIIQYSGKDHIDVNKDNWDQLFHLSDNSFRKYDKRSTEESETTSPSKRVCRQQSCNSCVTVFTITTIELQY